MKKIKLTQGKVALVSDVDYEYLSRWKWYASWDGYDFRAMRNSYINSKRKTIHMYRIIAERMGIDSRMIDHEDQNPLNNKRSNLRGATCSQNLHNRRTQSNNTTGVKGVCFYKRTGRYMAYIMVEGRRFHLGYFDTLTEATIVVQCKREELVGEFTCH